MVAGLGTCRRPLARERPSVLLETGPDGKGNWVLGDAGAPKEAEAPASSAGAAPPVLQNVKLGNLRITYRERGKPDRVALIETLSIGLGSAGLLALSGKGSLNELPATMSGEPRTPRCALLRPEHPHGDRGLARRPAARRQGGSAASIPWMGPISLKVGHPDVGAMLKKLHLPVMVSGALSADARLADAGELTRLDLAAKLGDITLKVGARSARSACPARICGSTPRWRMPLAWRRRST